MNQGVSGCDGEGVLHQHISGPPRHFTEDQNWGRCRYCNKGGLLFLLCETCNQDGIVYEHDLVNMYRNQKITGKELEDRVIQVLVTSTRENEVQLFFKVISEMMGIDNENLREAFANDRIEMTTELKYSTELDYNNVQAIIKNSYYINNFHAFETDDHNYLTISISEYLCMLEVGTIWLINQYIRDVPIAPIENHDTTIQS
jgi:hypothetical protein